jgi:AraC-like DNA-binding protein
MPVFGTPVLVSHVDSPLGRWTSASWRPPENDLVESIWYFEGVVEAARERVFPGGGAEIVLTFDAPYRGVGGAGGDVVFPAASVAGVMTTAIVVEGPRTPNAVLGLRLHPPAAARLLGHSLHALRDLTVDLRDVGGAATRELYERCGAARGAEARIGEAARWVAARLRAAPPGDSALGAALAELRRHRGAVRVEVLRERVGLSRSRMAALFRRDVGTSAKEYARILRFRHALETLQRGAVPLARVASAAGYYDQPHMTAEFRAMTGFSPAALARAQRFPGSANLAEG